MTKPRKGCQEDSDNCNHRRRNLLTNGFGLFGLVIPFSEFATRHGAADKAKGIKSQPSPDTPAHFMKMAIRSFFPIRPLP